MECDAQWNLGGNGGCLRRAGARPRRLADAREDVVTSLTRCAQLTDDRQWLDCYYGSAQPMRAWLGLSPAPQAQLKLLQKPARAQRRCPPPWRAPRCARGPPPKPKASGLFDVFGGSDVVNNAPVRLL